MLLNLFLSLHTAPFPPLPVPLLSNAEADLCRVLLMIACRVRRAWVGSANSMAQWSLRLWRRSDCTSCVLWVSVSDKTHIVITPSLFLAAPSAQAIPSICELMQHAKGDALNAAVETVNFGVELSTEVAIAVEPKLTPLLMAVWAKNATNPYLVEGVLETLESLASTAQCYSGVLSRALPSVIAILSAPAKQVQAGTVADALTLTHTLLKATEKHKAPVHAIFLQQVLPVLLQLLSQTSTPLSPSSFVSPPLHVSCDLTLICDVICS
jgi:hypothetical protein